MTDPICISTQPCGPPRRRKAFLWPLDASGMTNALRVVNTRPTRTSTVCADRSPLHQSTGGGEEEEAHRQSWGASDEARKIINPIHIRGSHLSCAVPASFIVDLGVGARWRMKITEKPTKRPSKGKSKRFHSSLPFWHLLLS